MRWQPGKRSRNLEDRRAQGPSRAGFGGRSIRIPLPRGRGGRISFTGILVFVGLAWLFGINPLTLLGGITGAGPTGVTIDPDVVLGGGGQPGSAGGEARTSPEEEQLVDFVSFVLDDVQTTWQRILPQYRDAKVVLFRGATRSGCGLGRSEMGPFYCPADEKVYVDLGFFEELDQRFGAPGDFAQAYVLGHEIGHHVQSLTGISERMQRQQQADPRLQNELSVRLELQADCFAGVWGNKTGNRGTLEPGDAEEGLRAAAAIGDDQLQSNAGRGVHPESFTHGTSEQRARWLKRGLESGDPEACDIFEIARP